jgi:hypothetical protein
MNHGLAWFLQAEATIKKELSVLTSRLKNSVPFFNFRSQVYI